MSTSTSHPSSALAPLCSAGNSMNGKTADCTANGITSPPQTEEYIHREDWTERMKLDSQRLWYRDEVIEYLGKKAVEQLRTEYLRSTERRMKEIWVEQKLDTRVQVEMFYTDYVKCFSSIVDAMILKKKRERLEQATRKFAPCFLCPKDSLHEGFAFTHILSHLHERQQGPDLVFLFLRQRPDLFVSAREGH